MRIGKSKFSEKTYALLFCLFFLLINSACVAQKNVLSRVSSAERSDGRGYVIRFHLSNPVDSFALAQPDARLIELALFGSNIEAGDIKKTLLPDFKVELFPLTHGVGMILRIKGEDYYYAQAYQDGASDDFLLALTRTTKDQLKQRIDNEEPLAWTQDLGASIEPADLTTTYERFREKLKIDVIVLDAGHGGRDPGAISYRGVYEKKIVMSITKKVGHYIKKYMPEVEVVYTRKGDYFVGLKERGHIANQANGDLFISIHANAAASPEAHGTEVYFLGLEKSKAALRVMRRENNVVDLNNKKSEAKISQREMFIYSLANSANIAASQKLAGMIVQQFKTFGNRHSRGVKQARFVVLYHASMPAVLVEVGFITNPQEAKFLTSEHGQTVIAKSIFRAIRNYRQQFARKLGYAEQ